MAVRTPLYNNAGNLQEMTSVQIDNILSQIVYQYSLSPSVTLSVVGSGGSLGTISDTRLQAGAVSTSTTAFPSEATTQEPQTVTENYSKIDSATVGAFTPTADTGKTWPVYQSAGNIYAMTLTDVKDTFLHPAIDLLVAGTTTTDQAGTYFISTSASVAGATEVSGASTPIFTDTRADTTAYSDTTIGDHALDNPTTISNFYLHRINGSDNSYTAPIFIRGDNDLQVYPAATFESLVQEWIRYTAAFSADGYAISYSLSSGTTRGSGITNTILNGSGDYQTRQVTVDDYRAQEFPDGVPSTASTTYLRISKS